MTNSTICCRFSQHKGALNRKDKSNALWEHAFLYHKGNDMKIKDFEFEILKYCYNNKHTAIYENQFINSLKPKINRKFEMSTFNYM